GCLNTFCKINTEVLQMWARVMNGVTGSKLIILASEGNHRQRVLDTFAKEGVKSAQVAFVTHRPRLDYLKLYNYIDISLDTFPCNGHTTSLDSYWMGVPVVTLVGNTIIGRAGLSQLTNLNLPELIAHTPEQFIQIATNLAGKPQELSALRTTLRTRM